MKHRQPLLFEPPPRPPDWERDETADVLVAQVVFSEAPYGPFDYQVPEALRGQVEPGRRLRVPLGRGDRLVVGYCVAIGPRGESRGALKPVWSVIDSAPVVDAHLLRLSRWMSDHYLCAWGQTLEAVVPAGVREQAGTREQLELSLAPGVRERLAELQLRGKQAAAIAVLANSLVPLTTAQLCAAAQCTEGPLQVLRKKGHVVATRRRTDAVITPLPHIARDRPLVLNPEQRQALLAIQNAMDTASIPPAYATSGTGTPGTPPQVILLLGITGSGKTEVYIQAIEEVVRRGRQAIVLVPEISLTPQTRQRFQARFADVAVLHSHLSDSQRHAHWQRIARGEVQVIVGARSAIFAPTPRLGLIVIDEEHDASFKQDSAPRYHARDVAIWRAHQAGVPLVLGSATPSLESWSRAISGEFQLVELTERATGQPLPNVETIDLRNEPTAQRGLTTLSRSLERAMTEALRGGGQVILLLNRRGHSTHIQCPSCGYVATCPDCDLPLTLHRAQAEAQCHYCDFKIPAPNRCPQCRGDGIRWRGMGTERLEEEIRRRFPHSPVLRMDSDTMQRHGSHETALQQFRDGNARILVGTQMIAKGLDFPNVTLVGVINADTALHLADFRAGERTFQLVTQVAGRSGRGPKGGRVLVQTASPDHPAIVAASRHDFRQFAGAELANRIALGYPPASHLIRLIFRGPQPSTVEAWADEMVRRLRAEADRRQLTARMLGPAPCPLERVQGRSRFHALLLSQDGAGLRTLVREVLLPVPTPRDIQWQADVDPLEMQ